jgi:hypothetical protein
MNVVRFFRELVKALIIGMMILGPMYVYLQTGNAKVFWLYVPFTFLAMLLFGHYETMNQTDVEGNNDLIDDEDEKGTE